MKVIFLDIDGVLNSFRTAHAYDGYPSSRSEYDKFDDVAVTLIRDLCVKNDIKVVLSSTWRLDKNWKKLENTLKIPLLDRTPYLSVSTRVDRGREIAIWLEDHPEVTVYAIIDDDSDMLEEQKPFFVHTCYKNGFSYDNYEQLRKIFGVEK